MDILPQILMNALITAALYGLVALGFNLIYGTVKFFDLAYGSVLVISGYVAYYCTKLLGLPETAGIIAALVVSALFGIVLSRTIYRHLQQKKASNMIYIVASLGVFTVVQAIISMLFTSQFQTVTTSLQDVYRIGSVVVTEVQLITIGSFVLIGALLAAFLKHARMGKAIRAVADDAEVSEIIGINSGRITAWVFGIGSVIGAVAGLCSAYDVGIEPTTGFLLLLKGVIAAIIGGVGNIWGGVIGALILGLLENLGVWQFSSEWKDVIAFSVLILFLAFRPNGLFKK